MKDAPLKRVRMAPVSLKLLPEAPTLAELSQFAVSICQPRSSKQRLEQRVLYFLVMKYGEQAAPAYLATPEFQRMLRAKT